VVSHQVCHDVSELVEENVSQPLQRCVEQDCNWWCLCCNKWLCFVVWVVVTVANWVVRTVCELVADTVDVAAAVLTGLVDVLVGIFTWNWARVWDGLARIVTTIVSAALDIVRIVTLGDLVGFVRDDANKWRLRNHVRGLIDGERRFTADDRRRIKDALGIDRGAFGFRMRFRAMRGFVRSDTVSGNAAVPDLVTFHNDPNAATRVDLRILAGFSSTTFWQRGRPEIVGDSGAISESDVDTYLVDPTGPNTKQFSIFSMSNSVLDTKLSTAVVKAGVLGLKLRFDKEDVQLTRANQLRFPTSGAAMATVFTVPPFNRARGSNDPAGAQRDLCSPISLATFLFDDNSFTGSSAHLRDATCLDGSAFPADDITASVHRDRLPDIAFRYVPIHEIGHTFGLCHVDGLDRIMFSPKQNSWLSWSLIPEYLWLSGEPSFSFDEAKSVWGYIVGTCSVECLTTRQF
jgi:hypothetical protein